MSKPFSILVIIAAAMLFKPALVNAGEAEAGFSIPEAGHVFSFPRDHGSHPDFKIEWWYVTGHLFTENDRRFGFQATFFRSSGRPYNPTNDYVSDFGDNTLYLAHMALLDVKTGHFLHQQRLNREGWDARSSLSGLDVRNGNWSLQMSDTNSERMLLRGSVASTTNFQLTLNPTKSLVVFGQNSVSRKAADPAAASYYLTFPRLRTEGQIVCGDETNLVHGEAWMDHEISSSQLGSDQAGWDWCCLQFIDGREIMAYRMRKKDGSQDPFSTLTWVSTNGVKTQLESAKFELETVRTWKSPRTGAKYPVSIRLHTIDPTSKAKVGLLLEPLADDQELADGGDLSYWEGACRVRDEHGQEVGSAFLELTGYAGDFDRGLR